MNKVAFKFNKPGFIKMFRYGSEKDVARAAMRQGWARRIIGLIPKHGGQRTAFIKELERELSKGKRKAAGTIYKTKKGKKVMIDRSVRKDGPYVKRNILAHEAFHAKVPLLGKSELLAHFYGGFKGKKGPISDKIREGLYVAGEAAKVLPGRVAGEIGAGAVGTYGAKKLIDKLTKKKDKK